MFLHDQCPLLVNHLAISACWGPTETWFALHQWVAMFEMVVPLLYLYDAHSIVTESLLNLLIRKICCITPVQVILSLCTSENLMGMHLLAGWLPATDTLCRQKKLNACTWRCPTPHLRLLPVCASFISTGEKIKSDYLKSTGGKRWGFIQLYVEKNKLLTLKSHNY